MDTIAGSSVLAVARDGGVLTLTLNRPERLNSLDEALLVALRDAVLRAAADDSVRAVVITGAGRGFCAGADLTQAAMQGGGSDGGGSGGASAVIREHLRSLYNPLVMGLRSLDKPVIASVNGVAAGAGMSLALACDLRIAAESATFIQAFVRIGLVPDAGATWLLPRLVGLGKAMELAMLGDRISAAEALSIGLVNRVVPDADLPAATAELAGRLAAGPRSLGLIKRALQLSASNDLPAQLAHEEEAQALAADSADFVEGVTSFLEKRAPHFEGR